MRLPPLGVLVAVAVVTTGCSLPSADSTTEPAPRGVELAFSYQADGGEGYIDQALTITNSGPAAGAPDLDLVALDDQGAALPEVEVVTAFGSDEGEQVVPAFTAVIEVLKFKGPGAADVADVEVGVADPGLVAADPPPANAIKVKRFGVSGRSDDESTLGSVLVANTYDEPITVKVVGLEFAPAAPGEDQHFKQVSELAGPLTLQPGEKVRERVAEKYRARFFGSVRAYLVQ